MAIEDDIGDMLIQRGMTLGLVESATGGLISHRLTNVPGCSAYYKGTVIAYGNESKVKMLGVSEATLQKYGAVSAEAAAEMAEGGKMALGVDVCLSSTGIAGPGGATKDKPVGLFFIGISDHKGTQTQRFYFNGSREEIKQSATEAALVWLRDYLVSLK